MEGDVYMTKVNLRTHMPDEKERRGQSRETAIEASTRTNFFFTNDRTFLIGSKRTVCCFDDVAVGRRADGGDPENRKVGQNPGLDPYFGEHPSHLF